MSHHSLRLAASLICAVLVTGTAQAETRAKPVIVVELFTSQGCSSCPVADEYLNDLSARDRILPLALHVDYWDYLGWSDKFAQPQFTQRQQDYARAVGSRMVYTPQMIVAGAERVEGNKPRKIEILIKAHLAVTHPVDLTVVRNGDLLDIRAVAKDPLDVPLVVQVVRFNPLEIVQIESGENAGMALPYRNIVTDWAQVGEWSGDAPFAMTVPVTGDAPVVVILQRPGPSEILAAALIE